MIDCHWSPWNEGLTNPEAGTNGNHATNTMILSADGLYLYFGTAGSGIFQRMTVALDWIAYLPLVTKASP